MAQSAWPLDLTHAAPVKTCQGGNASTSLLEASDSPHACPARHVKEPQVFSTSSLLAVPAETPTVLSEAEATDVPVSLLLLWPLARQASAKAHA